MNNILEQLIITATICNFMKNKCHFFIELQNCELRLSNKRYKISGSVFNQKL